MHPSSDPIIPSTPPEFMAPDAHLADQLTSPLPTSLPAQERNLADTKKVSRVRATAANPSYGFTEGAKQGNDSLRKPFSNILIRI